MKTTFIYLAGELGKIGSSSALGEMEATLRLLCSHVGGIEDDTAHSTFTYIIAHS